MHPRTKKEKLKENLWFFSILFVILLFVVLGALFSARKSKEEKARIREEIIESEFSDEEDVLSYINSISDDPYYSFWEVRDIFAYAFCTGYQDALKGVSDPLVREYSDIADYEYYDSKYGDMFP